MRVAYSEGESIRVPHILHTRFDELPAPYEGLLKRAGRRDFYSTAAWFQVLADSGLAQEQEPQVLAVGSDDGRALAVLPLVRRGRRLSGLANCYTTAFAPILADRTEAPAALARALAALRRHWDVLDLDALRADDLGAAALAKELRRAGMPVQRYFHFGNWFEDMQGLGLDAYVAARPGALRNTLKRHEAKLKKAGNVHFEIVSGLDGLGPAVAAYEAVYARSWKEPEPFPRFVPALARAAAAMGALRLGLAFVDGTPAAAQLWLVWHRRATIFKLAHDEAHKALSLGSLLTLRLVRHAVEVDRVHEIDFGRGDDDYKRLWLPRRRERWGLVAFNLHSPAGAALALRNIGGQWLKRVMRRG